MEGYDIDICLSSMRIIVDTREQPSERAEKRYQSFPCYRRAKLDYGDYSVEFKHPHSDEYVRVPVAIERKMSLDELATCFTRERKRFTAEFERAKVDGASVYLLVENATWENVFAGKYRSKMSPNAFSASLLAWTARYDCNVIFCKEETSGKLIHRILQRELRERLEDGFYG